MCDNINLVGSIIAKYYNPDNTFLRQEVMTVTANTLTFTLQTGQYVDINLPACNYVVTETALDSNVNTDMLADHYTTAYTVAGTPAAMPEFTITGQWLKDASENTYCYKEPLKPKAKTTNLLGSNIILGTKVVNDVTYYQVVEVFAKAIQSQPEKAVENSWGVTVENDAITAVP
ncbi:MAG: hypothetical protein IJD80_02490 [Oscillospiraceae bacterium]|nr:hypothetical protein [Oscillospiraceae bacterium]